MLTVALWLTQSWQHSFPSSERMGCMCWRELRVDWWGIVSLNLEDCKPFLKLLPHAGVPLRVSLRWMVDTAEIANRLGPVVSFWPTVCQHKLCTCSNTWSSIGLLQSGHCDVTAHCKLCLSYFLPELYYPLRWLLRKVLWKEVYFLLLISYTVRQMA